MTAPNWTEQELEQIRRWSLTTAAERLRWLEEAKRFAAAALAKRQKKSGESDT